MVNDPKSKVPALKMGVLSFGVVSDSKRSDIVVDKTKNQFQIFKSNVKMNTMGQSAQQFAIRYQNEVKPFVNDASLDQKIQNRIQYAAAREAENLQAGGLTGGGMASFSTTENDPPKPPLPPIETDPKPGDGNQVIDVSIIDNLVVKNFVIELEAFIDRLFEE